MQDTTAKVLLVHPTYLEKALDAATRAGIPRSQIFQFSDEENPTRQGIPDWRVMAATAAQGEVYRWPGLSPDESQRTVATISYSSGTTGLPKGVCVSHHNLISSVEQNVFIRYAHKP